ncbi:MAG: shikimate kinase [Lachnospiraceae bacterium]|nr:shikimate kinase [Lachnospiraceae bacterium]
MNNIILVGYMGCGKTTVGKNVAKNKSFTFIDTDEMIEKQQGKKISEIFDKNGEAAFRDMETEYLKQLLGSKQENLVISTGGGMAVREENRKLLAKLGRVIYLKVSTEVVYDRLKTDTTRPLLQCDDPLQKIKDMIAIRGSIYESAADEIICVDELKQSEIAEIICNRD